MKTQTNRLFLFVISLLISLGANAQIKEIGSMLSGSTADAEKLLQAYLKPYGNALGADLNGGWYNTAKPHKLLGFDLTASFSVAFVPSADKEFDASKLGLTGTVSPQNSMSPTVAGKKEQGQTISYSYSGNSLSYKTPEGTSWGVIPSPMFQLGLGLIKESDITFRYVPTLNIGSSGSFGLWGIGLKHSIKQWIPGIKMAPFFNLSVFLGYTKMKSSSDVSFTATDFNNLASSSLTVATSKNFDNQKMEMTFKGFTGNILASFDLPVVTFYGGIGIATTTTNLKLTGDYPFANSSFTQIIDKSDPINIKMSSSSGSVTKPRLNLGIKFKMAIIHVHFDYTYANYSVVTAGLGISVR